MNRNLTTVTFTLVALGLVATFDIIPGAGFFTLVALGLVATFDIIPGAGFYAGVAMLAIGATVFTVQLIGRATPLLGPRASPRGNVASA